MAETIQVRNVPKNIHALLTKHAERAGMSLNKYLLRELDQIALRGNNRAVFEASHAALKGRKLPTTEEIVKAIREMRGT